MKNIYAIPKPSPYNNRFRIQNTFNPPYFSTTFYIAGYGDTEEECIKDYVKKRDAKFAKYKKNIPTPIMGNSLTVLRAMWKFVDYRKLHYREGTTYGDYTKLRSYFEGELTKPLAEVLEKTNAEKDYKRVKDDKTRYKVTKNKELGAVRKFVRWLGGENNDDPVISKEVVDRMMNLLLPIRDEIKTEKRKRRFCEPEILLKALRNPKNKHSRILLYLNCCLEFGWRINEAISTCIGDIDFKRNTVSIYKGAKFNHWTGKLEIKSTKTDYSIRTITMTQELADMMKNYINEYQLDKPNYYLFFGKTRDVPVPIQTINNRIEKFLEDNDLPKHLKTHSWRHVNTTIMYRSKDKNITPKDIARRLGQASPEVSLRCYLEYGNDDKSIANIFEKFKEEK